MKKWIMAIAAAVFSLAVYAQDAGSTFKVGIVDVRQVIQKSPQIAEAQKKLQSEFAGREKEIQTVAQQLQADAEKLNRDSAVMSTKDRDALNKKVQSEQQNLNNLRASLQRDAYAKQSEVMQKIFSQMQTVITQIAKQKNLTIVLAKEAVAYAANDLDITNEVISQMK